MLRRVGSFVAPLIAAMLLATGCGGTDESGPSTTLLVTRDFGASVVKEATEVPVTKGLTAMRQLQSQAEIDTTYGGRFVNAIDGEEGGGGFDWLYFVNGIESDSAATEQRLIGGEIVQWDFHAWQNMRTSGAIVGAYPEPLRSRGVKLACADNESSACRAAKSALAADGVKESTSDDAVTFRVGLWTDVKGLDGVPDLNASAAENGAYAELADDGKSFKLANPSGELSVISGTGLIVATREGDAVTWTVTAISEQAVEYALAALDEKLLRGGFALAVGDEERLSLPLRSVSRAMQGPGATK